MTTLKYRTVDRQVFRFLDGTVTWVMRPTQKMLDLNAAWQKSSLTPPYEIEFDGYVDIDVVGNIFVETWDDTPKMTELLRTYLDDADEVCYSEMSRDFVVGGDK